MAEQRRFEQLAGDGAAVEHDEGAVLAGAVAVDLLGEQLLAGSGLAFDEHGRVGGGHVVEQTEQPAQLGVAADQRAVTLGVRRAEIERLFVGDVLQHRLADGDFRAEAERQLVEPRSLNERTIGRAEIARHHALRRRLHAQVAAGDGRVGERHVAPAPEPSVNATVPIGDRLPAVGTFDDQQPPAAGLPDDRCPRRRGRASRSSRSFVSGAGRAGVGTESRPSPAVAASSAARSARVASCPSFAPPIAAPSSTIRITRPGGPTARGHHRRRVGAEVDRLRRRQVEAALRVEPGVHVEPGVQAALAGS